MVGEKNIHHLIDECSDFSISAEVAFSMIRSSNAAKYIKAVFDAFVSINKTGLETLVTSLGKESLFDSREFIAVLDPYFPPENSEGLSKIWRVSKNIPSAHEFITPAVETA